jgi:23S rRNA pseudouridine955/2504/2580 synthase
MSESAKSASDFSIRLEFIKNRIIFEDADLLILDKPAGLAAHGDQHHASDATLITLVREYFKGSNNEPAFVHRLDKETSGLMIVAKTRGALRALNRQLKFKKITKSYLTLLYGEIKPKGSIRLALKKEMDRKRWLAIMVPVSQGGQHAQTDYQRIEIFNCSEQNFSLVETQPKTGRTHQLRAHFAALGCPIVGDDIYGLVETNHELRTKLGLMRMLLHAQRLQFEHPVTQKMMSLEAKLPPDFEDFLARLRSQ